MNVKRILTSFWEAWKRIGRAVGDLVGRLVLTVFYFTIFAPFGLGVRAFRREDSRSRGSAGNWIGRDLEPPDLKKAGRLF